jgi:GGDEF domain-containing protein
VIAALRAGANDVWGQPLDTEECLLRLEGYLRAKEDADHAREQSLVDEPTGFYNTHGLARRVRELAAAADRMARPLACLVVAPEPAVQTGERTLPGNGTDPRVEALGRLLKAAGRTSDAIARLGPREFVVLGLNTDADGALGLGERLGWAVRVAAREAGTPPLRLRAGCAAAYGFRASAVDPMELVNRALGALREAERENGDAWLHRAETPHPATPAPPAAAP